MSLAQRIRITSFRRAAVLGTLTAIVFSLTACTHVMAMMGHGAKRPAAAEFGLGPRPSASGRYLATLQPQRPLKPRQMQTVRVSIADADGKPIDAAAITIDGGMPQHGHGLPTRPRVTRALGNGIYEIEGVRFNMGGWWEFKVAVSAPPGSDTVTFNLDL